jgi:hypothetical protein
MNAGEMKLQQAVNKVFLNPIQYAGKDGSFYVKAGTIKFFSNDGKIEDDCLPVVFDVEGKLIGRLEGWSSERTWLEDVQQVELDGLVYTNRGVEFNHL